MKYAALAFITMILAACGTADYAGPTRTQDRLVQPGSVADQDYWDALNARPGSRTGEADFYYSHRGGR